MDGLNEADIIGLIKKDAWMMEVLSAARELRLPDWWICAGFVRSKVWDTLHGFSKRTPVPDIDLIYFDTQYIDEMEDIQWEEQIKRSYPQLPWSVKNEGRMHLRNHLPPYTSSTDAISKFPETASALGVKLDEKDQLILTAPHGVDDVLQMKVRPTPFFKETKERLAIYEERIMKKNWKAIWTKIHIETPF